MDNFENINNLNENAVGESATGAPETEPVKEDAGPGGYTVTPDGGFYTRSREDIIQDEAVTAPKAEPVYKAEEACENKKTDTYNGFEAGATYSTPQPPVKKPKKIKEKRRYGGGIIITASVLAAVIGAVSGMAVTFLALPQKTVTVEKSGASASNVNINVDEAAESVVEAVATKVTPSVIGVRTTTSVTSFFGGTSEASGEGSGVIYSSDGYIITNYHVVSEAISNSSGSKIEVFLDNTTSKAYNATVVGYNISADLAVLKIDANGLAAVEIADSEKLKVGQYVITVGNPGGLEFMDSVTYGVISGLNRVVSSDSGVELIQTDAAINPGNSGGALVNTKGQLVGINSSKIVSEEYEGMGFAIPSNTVVEICDKIIEKQNSPEPYIGITISEKYTQSALKYFGYPSGAVVLSVADGSPADKAGLERGDIITEFGGKEISEYTVLEECITEATPGETVSVKLYRGGRYYSTNITIGSNNAVG